MHSDNIQALLIAYIDGELPEEQRLAVEKNLAEDESLRLEYEQLREVVQLMAQSPLPMPDARLKQDFDSMLQEEIRLQQLAAQQQVVAMKPGFFRSYGRWAAAIALLIIGLLAGWLISRQQAHRQELLALQQEMAQTRQMVMASLQNTHSASQRLSGVLASQQLGSPDTALMAALIEVLNHDDNSNVRLAALQALLPYREEPQVYEALLASLISQDDPMVQISLINAMAGFKDTQIQQRLQQIVSDEKAPDMVKDEARVNLFRFS